MSNHCCEGNHEPKTCCCCNHEKKENRLLQFLLPSISILFLIGGWLISHYKPLNEGYLKIFLPIWYLIGFMPVGLSVIKESFNSIKNKDYFNEFTLMTIACIGAFFIGEYPEALALMIFYNIGETLQDIAVDKAKKNIKSLMNFRVDKARVIRDEKEYIVDPRDVEINEIIEIINGERIPLDGILLNDTAQLDTSALTGESMPREFCKSDLVLAGMINMADTLRLKVVHKYNESAYSRILRLINDASERKAKTEKFIRRFARIYTPIVVVLALLIAFIPALIPGYDYIFKEWFYRALVLLVVSCPCALVISVPLTYFASIGAASKIGILFKGGNFIDAIFNLDCIVFDKTGTLTTGKFHIDSITSLIGENRLLELVASAEKESNHPLALIIKNEANKRSLNIPSPQKTSVKPGFGIEADIDGKKVLVGNTSLMEINDISYPLSIKDNSSTNIICAINGEYVGAISLSDTIKEDTISTIENLKNYNLKKLIVLSGDKKNVVADFCKRIGICDYEGELLPKDKLSKLKELIDVELLSTAFIGDGINDAPALKLSHVGIAMGALGTDVALENADIVIQTDQPSKIVSAIEIGRFNRKIIKENIVFAILLKVLVISLAILGFVSLWIAVFADVGVALITICNSLRILNKKFE